MKTPIYDFVNNYAEADPKRFHMPGHKGNSLLGCEKLDITEISGADVLYEADGIINESENIASELFGTAHTFYSTEGSSLCIKAMLALAAFDGDTPDGNTASKERPLILAARNVHKSFINACALLDIDVSWIMPASGTSICGQSVTPLEVRSNLKHLNRRPCAVYITSPDYTGVTSLIGAISKICHAEGVPLIVDNAHGAYLAFGNGNLHPISRGADMCCDSAHKTLPALTGGSYLHISKAAPSGFLKNARSRLSLFASTSPSYLILQSLDLCNKYIAEELPQKMPVIIENVASLKLKLSGCGYTIIGKEPLKLTISLISPKIFPNELQTYLEASGIFAEYYDPEYAVFMISTENTPSELESLYDALSNFIKSLPPERFENTESPYGAIPKVVPSPLPDEPERKLTIREATLAHYERIEANKSLGRICASSVISCPPAVPISVSGEVIDARAVELFDKYGIKYVDVVL